MKKIFTALLLASTWVLNAYHWDAELKVAYYSPTNNTTKDIYKHGVLYSLEATGQSFCRLNPWVSVGILPLSGRSLGTHDKTDLTMVPIALGLKYFFPVKCLDLYAGAAVLPAFVHTHDHSPYVVAKRRKWGCGGLFKAGARYNMGRCFYVDAFCEYILLSLHYSATSTSVGRTGVLDGLAAGGGIGIKF